MDPDELLTYLEEYHPGFVIEVLELAEEATYAHESR